MKLSKNTYTRIGAPINSYTTQFAQCLHERGVVITHTPWCLHWHLQLCALQIRLCCVLSPKVFARKHAINCNIIHMYKCKITITITIKDKRLDESKIMSAKSENCIH